MRLLFVVPSLLLIIGVLWDTFETIILPRRVVRRLRITRLFYRSTWARWRWLSLHSVPLARRDSFLGWYGPLSLLLLIGIWAVSLICGFGLLQWSLGTHVRDADGNSGLLTDLYFSGTTFFTLGLGDVAPKSGVARTITVFEAGTGFAFLALVIGYLPVLYQAFSSRELHITLLDARAGSPPTAGELFRRAADGEIAETTRTLLTGWERWSAELLESHLSYPLLAYYRSQHDNHSWLAALTMVLDVCALIMAGIDGIPAGQAHLTFAMARHSAVDLSQIFATQPRHESDRLPAETLAGLREVLADAGVHLADGDDVDRRLTELRGKYEPYVSALSEHLMMPLPPWLPESSRLDAWQSTAWND